MPLEIVFNHDDVTPEDYPEAILVGKCNIMVEAGSIYTSENAREIMVFINGSPKVYTNVMFVRPYYDKE